MNPSTDHIAASDPANNPLSLDAWLEGGNDASSLIQSWQSVTEDSPLTQQVDQQVLTQSQSQNEQQLYSEYMHDMHTPSQRASDASLLEYVKEGRAASDYEPKAWPRNPITPDPYQHLTHTQGGGNNEHNNIEGALGVQSASIPWDYRHYSGNLNSHRKAEPLVYTPLVLAKSHDGTSAIDLTSLTNQKYQSQRMSSNPQYANTLSALTDYEPVESNPTDHWLPQMPSSSAPGVKNQKFWEKHFLDLYAPTPPPLLAPVPPQPKNRRVAPAVSLAETQSIVLPSILSHGERVQSLVTPVLDHEAQPVAFHDVDGEQEELKHSREMNMFAPSSSSSSSSEEMSDEDDHTALVYLEIEQDFEEHPALAQLDVDTPFPQAIEEEFAWE